MTEWKARRFWKAAAVEPAGPPPARIKRALASVGFADVELDSGHVRLHRTGAALIYL